jgi:hypothetical protein
LSILQGTCHFLGLEHKVYDIAVEMGVSLDKPGEVLFTHPPELLRTMVEQSNGTFGADVHYIGSAFYANYHTSNEDGKIKLRLDGHLGYGGWSGDHVQITDSGPHDVGYTTKRSATLEENLLFLEGMREHVAVVTSDARPSYRSKGDAKRAVRLTKVVLDDVTKQLNYETSASKKTDFTVPLEDLTQRFAECLYWWTASDMEKFGRRGIIQTVFKR